MSLTVSSFQNDANAGIDDTLFAISSKRESPVEVACEAMEDNSLYNSDLNLPSAASASNFNVSIEEPPREREGVVRTKRQAFDLAENGSTLARFADIRGHFSHWTSGTGTTIHREPCQH